MPRVVNVLIVALVLLIGGCLVIATIAKVREVASRVQCMNNLRQVGLAMATYQEQNHHFPRAAIPNPALAPEARLSWLTSLVPYIESNDLWYRMDKEKGWEAEANRFAALTPYAVYRCPGRAEGTPSSPLVPTNYVGLAGIGTDAATLPRGDARAGFLGYERNLTNADIMGRTNTILAATETTRVEGTWTAAGPPTVRGVELDQPPYLGNPGQFGGLHFGGANGLFADGSVRFLSRDIGREELKSMVTLPSLDESEAPAR
jgi:prepilin-type processing-associated H-X9-DG protein